MGRKTQLSGRVSAVNLVGCGFETQPGHTKTLNLAPIAFLLHLISQLILPLVPNAPSQEMVGYM